jgi:hypothetical protein
MQLREGAMKKGRGYRADGGGGNRKCEAKGENVLGVGAPVTFASTSHTHVAVITMNELCDALCALSLAKS